MRSRRTILLISADDLLKRTTAIIFISAGYNVIMAAVQTEAIQILESEVVDLVFFDIQEEPFAFLLEMLQKCPGIPLLVLGRVDRAEEVKKLRSQFTCLDKPVDPETILEHVRKILLRQSLHPGEQLENRRRDY